MLTRPGYWCTCATEPAHAVLRSLEADTAIQALIWIRVMLRTIVSALDPPEVQRAYAWLDHGQWEAIQRLKDGRTVTFEVTVRDTRIEWYARRVLFLPLLHREDGLLPLCAHQYACPVSDHGYRCAGR
ncbi:hypothetical protein ACZ90_61220 [Streptomyces albus subsp. albus]|nr:hypothetical protein ACZ90_61220 [Streptomyces albus subsp. albus]